MLSFLTFEMEGKVNKLEFHFIHIYILSRNANIKTHNDKSDVIQFIYFFKKRKTKKVPTLTYFSCTANIIVYLNDSYEVIRLIPCIGYVVEKHFILLGLT